MVWRPFYFANLIVDPEEREPRLQAGPRPHRQHRRRQELQQHRRRRARRLPRRVDRPDEHRPRDHRRRRRPLVLVRRRQQVVEGGEPADLAVLPRERRHGPAVPRLRRAAGQQLVGRRLRSIPAASPTATGRTCTAATASGCSPIRPIPTTSTPSRRAATSAASTARRTRSRDIKPLPGYKEGKLRFNWNTPIHISPTQKGTIYIGAQFLFRSRDHGQTWERISPDLTTNDPEKQKQEQSGGVTVDNSSAEMHTTIYAIAESPKDAERDLGRHRRRQRAAHARRRQDLDERRRATSRACRRTRGSRRSKPGHFDAGTAYATFDLHTFGDMTPVRRTRRPTSARPGRRWSLPTRRCAATRT